MILGISTNFDAFVEAVNQSIGLCFFNWKLSVEVDQSRLETDAGYIVDSGIEDDSEVKEADIKENEYFQEHGKGLTKKIAGKREPNSDHKKEKLTGVSTQIKKEEKSLDEKIVEILKREGKGIQNLYIKPKIPKEKQFNARKKCRIPTDEVIIGLLDLTLKGSAKNCLVFCKKNIYFHNSFFSFIRDIGRNIISYKYLIRHEINYGRYFDFKIGDFLIDISVMEWDMREKVGDILNSIKKLIKIEGEKNEIV